MDQSQDSIDNHGPDPETAWENQKRTQRWTYVLVCEEWHRWSSRWSLARYWGGDHVLVPDGDILGWLW